MSFSKKEFDTILQEETIKLLAEEGVQEGFLDRIKDLYKSFTKPTPNASQGVGRAFAGYKYKTPAKQTAKTTPQQEPEKQQAQTGLTTKKAGSLEPSDDISGPQDKQASAPTGTYDLGTQRKLPPSQQVSLPAGENPPETSIPSGELPPSDIIQKRLPAPGEIGVMPEYQPLMLDIDKKDFENLRDNIVSSLEGTPIVQNKNEAEKKQIIGQIETVLKYLVTTKRVIQNPTIGPKNENTARRTPSMQQIGAPDFDSWYVNSLFATTVKHFQGSISNDIIKFVIRILFSDGRLAISQRLYNKLIHTNDPRITNNLDTEDDGKNINESKSYSNFYNSWKKYTKTGVTL
jgi:hypothetical protein